MEKFTQKALIALIAMGFISNGAAQGLNGCCFACKPSFFAGVDGLYLNPISSNLNLLDSLKLQNNVATITTAYHWAYSACAGIIIGPNDLTVGYTYFNSNDNNSLTGPEAALGLLGTIDAINSNVHYRLQDFSVAVGHTSNFGCHWQLRAGLGLDYSQFKRAITIVIDNDLTSIDRIETLDSITYHFYGIGPKLDIDLAYNFACNFSLFAKSSTALLVSDRKTRESVAATFSGTTSSLDKTFYHRVMVPALNLKTGISYCRDFGVSSCHPWQMSLEAGWQDLMYINANDVNVLLGSEVSNMTWDGPFLGIKVKV